MEQPLWSILIATMPHREAKFLRLAEEVLGQARYMGRGVVEVIGLQNTGEAGIAVYRDMLLSAAAGKYLCFIDDDDMVTPDYVSQILGALAQNPDVVGFKQYCTGTGAPVTELSLQHEGASWEPQYYRGQMAYLRKFSHVQPVLTELAQNSGGFGGSRLSYSGEDVAYVDKVVPLLRARGSREIFLDEILYQYLWNVNDTTQGGPPNPDYVAHYAGHPRPVIDSPCFRWYP